jgi:hypothetical protein
LKANNLHVSVNLHDASGSSSRFPKRKLFVIDRIFNIVLKGVRNWDTYYAPMATANGINPQSGKPIPFNVTSELYMDTLHSIVMQPVIEVRDMFLWKLVE